jgi:hypothetical protein
MSSIHGDETKRATLQTDLTRDNVFNPSWRQAIWFSSPMTFSAGISWCRHTIGTLTHIKADISEAAYCRFFTATPYDRNAEYAKVYSSES